MSKEVKEPAVRMIKRDTISTAKAWGIRLIAVVQHPSNSVLDT